MKDCPSCHLANPDSGLRCDCGYDFPSGVVKESYLPLEERRLVGKSKTGTVGSFLGDIAVFSSLVFILHSSPEHHRFLTLQLVIVGAVLKFWNWGRFLVARWGRLVWH